MQKEIKKLSSNQSIPQDRVFKGSNKFELRTHKLQDNLGSKPVLLIDKFDRPSLWETVGMMGSAVLNVEKEQQDSPTLQVPDIQNIVLDFVQDKLDKVEDKDVKLKETLITVSKHLKAQPLVKNKEII